ncbi:MAG: hypothetical protein DCF21_18625 [Leptolyngbya sp.]|uniref:Uncharacterized protein n=1 Tax=Shackletoniella antarctica TaxID=268115 RepID=A0A2W4VMP8_9CYAN|nr:MAG: hypothetical protein DCF17_20875 [Shackletoniella antarctica]PZV10344.1 MAG: hypothetical protein DCF21_18625 [Leptolyngbya sp.]
MLKKLFFWVPVVQRHWMRVNAKQPPAYLGFATGRAIFLALYHFKFALNTPAYKPLSLSQETLNIQVPGEPLMSLGTGIKMRSKTHP